MIQADELIFGFVMIVCLLSTLLISQYFNFLNITYGLCICFLETTILTVLYFLCSSYEKQYSPYLYYPMLFLGLAIFSIIVYFLTQGAFVTNSQDSQDFNKTAYYTSFIMWYVLLFISVLISKCNDIEYPDDKSLNISVIKT